MDEKFLKLTNTVYKILEFFPESDPLKNRAKDKALAIMEHLTLINEASGWASFQKEKTKARLLEDIDVFLGYLWIGKSQGWLNSVNCLIIANEYEKIKKEIEPMGSVIEFTQKFPNTERRSEQQESTQIDSAPILKNPIAQKEEAPNFSDIPEHQNTPAHEVPDRQRKIMEFLEKNEKAQVMDLQTILPDVTKRTIRRDLDELLEDGKIVRLGDFNEIFYRIK